MATIAINQFLEQLFTAELASVNPIAITIGPVTTGGKKRIMRAVPNALNSADNIRYKIPAHATPKQAYGNISGSLLGATTP